MSGWLENLLTGGDPLRLIGQIVGLIPMVLAFFVFIFNDRRKTIFFKLICDLLWVLHLSLLGAWSGAVINAINAVRGLVFFQKGRKWASHKLIPVVFIAAGAVGTLLTGDGFISLLPLVGTSLGILGFWCNDPRDIRKLSLPAVTLWLIYGCIIRSFSTVVSNGISIVAMVIAEINYRREKQ